MKFLAVAIVASIAMTGAAVANAQQELAQKSGCLNCHAVDTKKVGPAYKDVAAKYKGKADAEATLTDKLTSGKGHPPVKASPDDVKSLVKWILSM
jgi:cytochrome c